MDLKKYTFVRSISPELRLAAMQLRKDMTEAELLLWEALRDSQLKELTFRSQHAVGNFVLDFCFVA